MLMTEREARAKWCPLARVAVQDTGSDAAIATGVAPVQMVGNRALTLAEGGEQRTSTVAGSNCIASGCMAWRKENSFERSGKERSAYEREIGAGNTGRGYCGAFGKAEG